MSVYGPGKFIRYLIRVIHSALRKIKHVYAERTESAELHLAQRTELLFDRKRRADVNDRTGIRHARLAWGSSVNKLRCIKQKRRAGQKETGDLKLIIADLFEVESRAAVRQSHLVEL